MGMTRSLQIMAALSALASSGALDVPGGEPPPRMDRHGKRLKVELTQANIRKKKSASLQKLLRK